MPLATVLTPAGKAKEMTQRASRQNPDEIQGKIAYQKPEELDPEDVHGPQTCVLFPREDSLSINTQ